jgi:cytohesin
MQDAPDEKGRGPFHWACWNGAEGEVAAAIGAGADVEQTDADGATGMHLAAHDGHVGVIRLLLKAGARAGAVDAAGVAPLHEACANGHAPAAAELLAAGADPCAADADGITPLHLACARADVLRVLLTCPLSSVDVRDRARRTPLHFAARHGNADSVAQLLLAGADPLAADSRNHTAAYWACEGGHAEAARALATHGGPAAIDALAVRAACRLDFVGVVRSIAFAGLPRGALHLARSAAMAEELIKAGAAPDERDKNGRAPLHSACMLQRPEVVRALLSHGARADVADAQGRTPLHLAKQADVALALLDAGADIDAADADGLSPLHSACASDCADVAQVLVARGADLRAADARGATPLHMVCDDALAAALADAGADVRAVDRHGFTPLMRACFHNRVGVVHQLVLRGAADAAAAAAFTPLHCAAAGNAVECARYLLSCGADPSARDADSRTPLYLACERNSEQMVSVLLEAGAWDESALETACEPCMLCSDGILRALIERAEDLAVVDWSADILFYMCEKRKFDIARMMIQRGADPLRVNQDHGITPLHAACKYDTDGGFVREFATEENIAACARICPLTLLHCACAFKNTEAAAVLLRRGARADAPHPTTGETPLQLAGSEEWVEQVMHKSMHS